MPAWVAYQQFTAPGWFAPMALSGLGQTTVAEFGQAVAAALRALGHTVVVEENVSSRFPGRDIPLSLPNVRLTVTSPAGAMDYISFTSALPRMSAQAAAGEVHYRLQMMSPVAVEPSVQEAAPLVRRVDERMARATSAAQAAAAETTSRFPNGADSRVPAQTFDTAGDALQQRYAEEAGVVAENGEPAPGLLESVPNWVWFAGGGLVLVMLMKGGR